MTTIHMRRRMNWRISALGLTLSLGLIFGASGIIRLNAAEPALPSAAEDVCAPAVGHQRAESAAAAPAVPFEGHPPSEFNL